MSNTPLEVGQQVTFKKAFRICTIQQINKNTAIVRELNTGFTYAKRLSSLALYVEKKAHWTEQELVNPIHNHGDVVFTTLSGDGEGMCMVWDEVKQECVNKNDLSTLI